MLDGAHVIIYSKDAEADRAFFRDVLKFPHVDVGEGWLIFALPTAELGVHPHDKNDEHQFFLMCADVKAFVRDMKKKKVKCGPVMEQPWGSVVLMTLPGGGKLGVYQARHARPGQAAAKPAKKRRSK